MDTTNNVLFPTANGYLTETIRNKYISKAVAQGLMPKDAHRMASIISLEAPSDLSKPIQFWQLYSLLGQDRIVNIVHAFYTRVFDDEKWFREVFERVGGIAHHVNTQASMWVDVMGGGSFYHGGEYRLSFHHTHNALSLMNEKGAKRWVELMIATLDDPQLDLSEDIRVRPAINTFLSYFMDKYADEFSFTNEYCFGLYNEATKRRINFLNMSSDAIEALSEEELTSALTDRGIDISQYKSKSELVSKALRL